ncbi:MAG: hypothetical protein EOO77_23330 [Oxalobacteraceae bacterium]|nr:MAG: hypothetical protein EOO77_23330 [Oxalobacteraceae bacterium]
MNRLIYLSDARGGVRPFLEQIRGQRIPFIWMGSRVLSSRIITTLHSDRRMYRTSIMIRDRDLALILLMREGTMAIEVRDEPSLLNPDP